MEPTSSELMRMPPTNPMEKKGSLATHASRPPTQLPEVHFAKTHRPRPFLNASKLESDGFGMGTDGNTVQAVFNTVSNA